MIGKDNCLRHIFDVLALKNAAERSGACKYRTPDEIYWASSVAVFKGMPLESELDLPENTVQPYDSELPTLNIGDLSKIRPEVMLYNDSVPLTNEELQPDSSLLALADPPVMAPGLWSLKNNVKTYAFRYLVPVEEGSKLLQLPIQPIAVPAEVSQMMKEDGYTADDLRACLMVTRLAGVPVLMLTGETSMLYLPLCRTTEKSSLLPIVHPDGTVYVGDAWNNNTHSWKKLIKKRNTKMKGLGNPLTKGARTPAEAIVTKAEATEPEVAEAIEAPVETKAEPEEAPKQAPAPEPAPEPVEHAPEPVEHAEEPVARRTRTRKQAKSVGINLAPVIEELGSDVADLETAQLDAAVEEIRALRDLQVAAARRTANIVNALYKASKQAVDKYVEICKLIK